MKVLAIEGINGSGKTPTIELLKNKLEEADLKTTVAAPYHLVRNRLETPDIYPLWQVNPGDAVSFLHETLDEVEQLAASDDTDVLVYDRHWMTAFTQIDSVPHLTKLWGNRFVPTVTLSSPSHHVLRLALRGYEAPWLSATEIMRYNQIYDDLSKQHSDHIVGRFVVRHSGQDLQPIANAVFKLIRGLNDVRTDQF